MKIQQKNDHLNRINLEQKNRLKNDCSDDKTKSNLLDLDTFDIDGLGYIVKKCSRRWKKKGKLFLSNLYFVVSLSYTMCWRLAFCSSQNLSLSTFIHLVSPDKNFHSLFFYSLSRSLLHFLSLTFYLPFFFSLFSFLSIFLFLFVLKISLFFLLSFFILIIKLIYTSHPLSLSISLFHTLFFFLSFFICPSFLLSLSFLNAH